MQDLKYKRVLVCGSRYYGDISLIEETLGKVKSIFGDFIMVTGACPTGADNLAEEWAKKNEVRYIGFPAQWDKHGKAAGPIRNKDMLDTWSPEVVVAFGKGRGTDGMVKLAEGRGDIVIWRMP